MAIFEPGSPSTPTAALSKHRAGEVHGGSETRNTWPAVTRPVNAGARGTPAPGVSTAPDGAALPRARLRGLGLPSLPGLPSCPCGPVGGGGAQRKWHGLSRRLLSQWHRERCELFEFVQERNSVT